MSGDPVFVALEAALTALPGLPPGDRRSVAEALDRDRTRAGVPASALYAAALTNPVIAADEAVRPVLLDALVREADAAGSALLQRLRGGAPKKLRASFQVALLKLETARIAGGARGGAPVGAADTVRAWISQPDGQGATAVLVAFDNGNGTCAVADLCFRLTRDLRQGFVVPRATERELREMIEELTCDSIEVVRAPLGEVATVVDEALASHRATGVPTPGECADPVRWIDRLPRSPLPSPPEPVAVSFERARELMRDRRHECWFFDRDDLAKNARGATPGDATEVLEALGRSSMRARVEAMARYMVHFARWSGDAALAAEWSGLAAEVARDFAGSALARAMYEATHTSSRAKGTRMEGYGVEGMLIPFSELFPDVSLAERRLLSFRGHARIPDGVYVFEEAYCTARKCNCQRVTFHVIDAEASRIIMRVGYAFTDAAAKRFYTQRTVADPTSTRLPWTDAMVKEIDARVRADATWQAELKRHYAMARSL